jgi:hypothetical protein
MRSGCSGSLRAQNRLAVSLPTTSDALCLIRWVGLLHSVRSCCPTPRSLLTFRHPSHPGWREKDLARSSVSMPPRPPRSLTRAVRSRTGWRPNLRSLRPNGRERSPTRIDHAAISITGRQEKPRRGSWCVRRRFPEPSRGQRKRNWLAVKRESGLTEHSPRMTERCCGI